MPTQRRFEIVNTHACARSSATDSAESSSRMARDDAIVFWLCVVLAIATSALVLLGVVV